MKHRWMQIWSDLTLWSLAMRRASREFPNDNDLVWAILSRQAMERNEKRGKNSVAETGGVDGRKAAVSLPGRLRQ
jgi:hypothetical protein